MRSIVFRSVSPIFTEFRFPAAPARWLRLTAAGHCRRARQGREYASTSGTMACGGHPQRSADSPPRHRRRRRADLHQLAAVPLHGQSHLGQPGRHHDHARERGNADPGLDVQAGRWSSPTVYDGVIYIGARNGYFYAISETTGSVIWKRFIGYVTHKTCGAAGFTSTATVAADPGTGQPTVYVYGATGYLYAMSAASGADVW